VLTLALTLTYLSGCAYHSWRPARIDPPTAAPGVEPDAVRITLADGDTVTIVAPWITGDSIVGEGGRVAISAVRTMEARELDVTATLVSYALVGGLVYLATFGAMVLLSLD
jgi:hypothetical protein